MNGKYYLVTGQSPFLTVVDLHKLGHDNGKEVLSCTVVVYLVATHVGQLYS